MVLSAMEHKFSELKMIWQIYGRKLYEGQLNMQPLALGEIKLQIAWQAQWSNINAHLLCYTFKYEIPLVSEDYATIH